VQRGIDGICRKCSRRFRKSQIPEIHKHKFTIIVVPNELEAHHIEPNPGETEFNSQFIVELAKSTAELNFSLRQATSESMKRLLTSFARFGFVFAREYPDRPFKSIPGIKFSRRQLRTEIISLSDIMLSQSMEQLKNTGLVTLAIDNGTIINRHILFITSTNPHAGLRPLFFDSRTTKHWRSDEFAEFGIQITD